MAGGTGLTDLQALQRASNAQNEADFIRGTFNRTDAELAETVKDFGVGVATEAGRNALIVGPLLVAPEAAPAGRAALQAGKALARDPRVFVETTNFGVNLARGFRLGRNLDVFQRPLGFGPGSVAGHALGVGAGVASRFGRFVDDLF